MDEIYTFFFNFIRLSINLFEQKNENNWLKYTTKRFTYRFLLHKSNEKKAENMFSNIIFEKI